MKLTKIQRSTLREKFGGRCAYCGQPLGEKWHADHIEAVERELKYVRGEGLVATGKLHRPERDTLANLNPACPPCNLDKHAMTLEDWRGMIERSNDVLARDVSTFRRAVRYGLVQLEPKPVVFYFERLAAEARAAQEKFIATALQLDHITGCSIEQTANGVQVEVEAYLATPDGSTVERGHALVYITQDQFTNDRWSTPGPWLLATFDRTIAEKWRGYTRYATPEEIAAHGSTKGEPC